MPGFQVSSTQSSNSTGMGVKRYGVPVTETVNIAIGDIVLLNGEAEAEGTEFEGTPQVELPTNGANAATGVVVGADFDVTNLFTTGIIGGKGGFLQVAIDPNLYFDADVSGTPYTTTDVGRNASFTTTAAEITGILMQSKMDLASPTVVVDNAPFRVIEILRDSAGVFGGRARVRMNSSTQAPGDSEPTIEALKTKDAIPEYEKAKDSYVDVDKVTKKAVKGDKS